MSMKNSSDTIEPATFRHERTKLVFGRCLVQISTLALVHLTGFRDILSPSRKMSEQHFKLRHFRFLPYCIQFIIH